jgi:hypothetical protein
MDEVTCGRENGREEGKFTAGCEGGYDAGFCICSDGWAIVDETGCGSPVTGGGTLYEAAGAGKLDELGGAVVFWRAIFARASRIDWPFWAGAAGGADMGF